MWWMQQRRAGRVVSLMGAYLENGTEFVASALTETPPQSADRAYISSILSPLMLRRRGPEAGSTGSGAQEVKERQCWKRLSRLFTKTG